MGYQLHLGDCLEIMPNIQSGSVDAIIADLPYGSTKCAWDVIIPFDDLWKEYKRIIKPKGAIVLFGNQPFTTLLIASNFKWFKYELVWDKTIPAGMSYARFQPMRQHENIVVFCEGKTTYNPQMVERSKPIKEGGKKPSDSAPIKYFNNMGGRIYTHKQPITIMRFRKIRKGSLHPTQKPVDLLEYLVETYTNAGETILDNTMGSGTTGVACMNTGRNFIGIEKEEKYYLIAKKRIEESTLNLSFDSIAKEDQHVNADLSSIPL